MFNEELARRRVAYVVARFFVFLLLGAAGVASSMAQAAIATGNVSGMVSDETGAPVPGASVVLINKSTGQQFPTKTDASGRYRILNFPPGAASITIAAKGFPVFKNAMNVIVGQNVTQNAVLSISSAIDSISATAVVVPVPVPLEAVAPQVKPDSKSPTVQGDYVIVSANAVAGPMGYVVTSSLSSAVQSQSAQQQALASSQGYNFPSIIFYISAVPLVNLPSISSGDSMIQNEDTTIQKDETDLNPLWLDASFTLTFFDQAGNPINGACTDGSVQILGLLPQQTVSAMKNQTIADIATGVNDVAGALASFYPGEQNQVTAATKAMNVVFQDIFPPQPVAYEYSNMNGNCDFGWYFRPNKSTAAGASGPASILGIQTGILLLKTKSNIASINVNGRSISAWNKPPTSASKSLFTVSDRLIGTITLPDVSKIDFNNLTTLAMFPSLIKKSDAMQIVHIEKDADFIAFATAKNLVGTNATFDYVTNNSLAAFLSLSAPAATGNKAAPVADVTAPATTDGKGTAPPPTTKPTISGKPVAGHKASPTKATPAATGAH
ncbi:MAG: carboxypeptidase-like regulatory domain-containing protein [Terracidiphilus sp.]